MNAEWTMELLRIMHDIDDHGMCIWHPQDDGTIEFHVICNDLSELETGLGAMGKDGVATAYTADLYCARHRGMRPQRPYSKNWSPGMLALFDACGPERDRKEEG